MDREILDSFLIELKMFEKMFGVKCLWCKPKVNDLSLYGIRCIQKEIVPFNKELLKLVTKYQYDFLGSIASDDDAEIVYIIKV